MSDDLPQPAETMEARPGSAWNAATRARRRPGFGSVIALFVVWFLITSAARWLPYVAPKSALALLGHDLAIVVPALAALVALAAIVLGRWSEVRLRMPVPGSWRFLILPALYLPVTLGILLWLGLPPATTVIGIALIMVWVAVSEEVMFRGLLYPALRLKLGFWSAAWTCSLIFGASHLNNGLASGAFTMAVLQSLAAVPTGFLLLALRLRTGSLLPPILFHLVWNLGAFSMAAAEETHFLAADMPSPLTEYFGLWFGLIFVAPNGLIAAWMLRPSARAFMPGDPDQA